MEFIEDNIFDDYIKSYKDLNINDKKKLVQEKIYELLIVLVELNRKHGKNLKVLYNREILDLKKNDSTESDFVEAMFVYIHSIQELLTAYAANVEK